jgi:hypothetical protein
MKTTDEMKRGLGYEYKRVDVSTLAGLKEAERLQARGWKSISGGLFTVLLEKTAADMPQTGE